MNLNYDFLQCNNFSEIDHNSVFVTRDFEVFFLLEFEGFFFKAAANF